MRHPDARVEQLRFGARFLTFVALLAVTFAALEPHAGTRMFDLLIAVVAERMAVRDLQDAIRLGG